MAARADRLRRMSFSSSRGSGLPRGRAGLAPRLPVLVVEPALHHGVEVRESRVGVNAGFPA